ncbi:hypothetical protein DFR50_10736 [Roseiarcus fermentans]|uniref:ParB-like nuclease n=1 Tax=Roseiarcus fermentans TaxID=1473586 RepID=A0A366FNQ0_9HYPH|nr:ParB-like protein [Roseiarcus fermentans]RBP15766.1 hypothetical protein DFR50_10736 [Roseiarcus fermentans]
MSVNARDPVLHPTPILSLRPTQMTVGMEEVRRKRDAWKTNTSTDLAKFLGQHMVPTVIGPGGRRYLIDHHHLALALHEEGVESVFVTLVADLGRLPDDLFWNMMSFQGWTHPYDAKGVRRPFADLPKTVAGMEDDPYRSLAGALRNSGGFAKDSAPFAEFLWADYLRARIKAKTIKTDFEASVAEAQALARLGEADYLPGWCGPHAYAPAAAVKAAGKTGKTGTGKTPKSA